ncbi:MAG: FKBP-type peptidyl-prolyl cis-trans isomerase FklB, partial [Candidatus Marinamargulisbacteria bacterium]
MEAIMKKFAVLCALTVFVAGCNATGTAVKTDEDKQSYALGYNVGATLKQQGFELKSKVLAKGVTDALSGKPAISEEEIAKVLTELRKEKIAELQKQQVEIAKINLAASQSFLTKNKVKKGVVTLPSGLQYKVIRAGKGK